jgi:cytochrome P450
VVLGKAPGGADGRPVASPPATGAKRIPAAGRWLFPNLLGFQRDPLRFLTESRERYGDIFRFHVLGLPMVMVNHPDYIEHVLVRNSDNYDKQALLFKVVRPVLGSGLIGNPGGTDHQRQRGLMRHAFQPRSVARFATNMTDETLRLCERWEAVADTGHEVNVTDDIGQVALRIVNRSLFSARVGDSARDFELAFADANAVLAAFFAFPLVPLNFPGPRRRRLRSAIERMNSFISTFVERRLAGATDGEDDLLGALMRATYEDNDQPMSLDRLHDEVLNIVIGAFETTTNAASWAFYLLSRHPDVERRFLDEVDSALRGRPPEYADLPRLAYTKMIVEETLRLYSPAWQTMRHSVEDDVVGGYRVPGNSNIYLNSYLMHRHPGFWRAPDRFVPERFTPEESARRPKHAYIPFGSGPRVCIGKYFALTELQLILATVARRFRLTKPAGQPETTAEPLITLHPRNGVRLLVQRR